MALSDEQLAAIREAQQVLEAAGLSLSDLSTHTAPDTPLTNNSAFDLSFSPDITPASDYEPLAARRFTPAEINASANCLNRKSRVDAIIVHPLGAIVEYPETGSHHNERVAHRFLVDPANFYHPKADFQYSLGDKHGGHKNVHCYLLRDKNGDAVLCDQVQTSCKSNYFASIGA